MESNKFRKILEQIAKSENVSVAEVRMKMQAAMDECLNSSNPSTQARWAAIPRKGSKLTLEEFVEYLANQTHLPHL